MFPWHLLDILFVAFHSALILFNLLGWMHPRTRRLNLVALVLTGLSWTLLGLFYGFGYCPLTDWHWQVLGRRGKATGQASCGRYLLERMLGRRVGAGTDDSLTLALYLAAMACSLYANFAWSRRGRQDH